MRSSTSPGPVRRRDSILLASGGLFGVPAALRWTACLLLLAKTMATAAPSTGGRLLGIAIRSVEVDRGFLFLHVEEETFGGLLQLLLLDVMVVIVRGRLDLLRAHAHRAAHALALDGAVHDCGIGELGAALDDLDWLALGRGSVWH